MSVVPGLNLVKMVKATCYVGLKLFTFFGIVERARSIHFLCRTVANIAVLLTEIRLWNGVPAVFEEEEEGNHGIKN